jgi:hypothetical protein
MRPEKIGSLSNEELEQLIEYMAARASDLAVTKIEDKIYKNLGKKIFDKILWITGAIFIGIVVYLNNNGVSVFK